MKTNKETQDMIMISNEWLYSKKMSVKYSTYIKYKNLIETQILPFFQKHSINTINETLIIDYLNEKYKHNYSHSTTTSIRFLLKSILTYAEIKYQVKHIDFQFIKLSHEKIESTILSSYQISCLDEYCFQHINPISLSILLALYGGLRIGEICALQWKDINLEHGIITVSKTLQRLENQDQSTTKTSLMILKPKTLSSQRQVPVPQFIIEYFQQYYSIYFHHNDDYILSHTDKKMDPRTIQYRFKKVCEIYHFSINFHALRHTYATQCVEIGIEIKSLSEILGHSNISTTLNRYVHSSLSFKQNQINKIKKSYFS